MKALIIPITTLMLLLSLTACAQRSPDDGMGDLWKVLKTQQVLT